MQINAYQIAQRFAGMAEVSGKTANPQIMAMLSLDAKWPEDDSVPWCSAFVNYVAWLLRLPRSKSLRARSWLETGVPVPLSYAEPGFDVVILKRGKGDQPGPEVIKAPGHVGFFAGIDGGQVLLLGGNQSDQVSIGSYLGERVLGVRRLYTPASVVE
ncbi:MAG: TIGR02594 family protein [Hyphomicrobium sp.]